MSLTPASSASPHVSLPASLVLVGAGKMGQALLDGWLALGLAPRHVTAIDPHLDIAGREAVAARGVNVLTDADGVAAPEALVLAIKPQSLEGAAPVLARLIGRKTFVLSILAGKRIADLAARLPTAAAIVRAMPNTPAAVGRGITAAVAGPGVDTEARAMADALLSAVGKVEWLTDESLIDAVTAVSGSGPAYVFHLVEALAQAGVAAGLPADLSMRLARATVEGAGELMHRTPHTDAAHLRSNVTSPGGTTAAALAVLTGAQGLTLLMTQAVEAARHRAEELAG